MRRVSAPGSTVAVVGAGASALVHALAAAGDRHVVAIDLSPVALEHLRAALGPHADTVRYLVGDVCDTRLEPPADLWHDRAAYHFLTSEDDQAAYARAAARSVRPGGHLVLAAFAETGPDHCSGLPVVRQSEAALRARFGGAFDVVEVFERDHHTPSGQAQRFVHAVLCRCAPDDGTDGAAP